jgi:hypothetical protein
MGRPLLVTGLGVILIAAAVAPAAAEDDFLFYFVFGQSCG